MNKEIQFGTSNDKAVYKQLKARQQIEFITTGKNGENLRVRGAIKFEEDRTVVENFINSNPATQNMYKGREDAFELFYLSDVEFNWFSWSM